MPLGREVTTTTQETKIDGIGVRLTRRFGQPRLKRQAPDCTDFKNQDWSEARSFCHASLRCSF